MLIIHNRFAYKQRQSGIALIIVLWMLSLLIILATGYSSMVRIESNLTANFVHANQARAIAEAGIWQSITELLKPISEQQWKTDGTEYQFEFKQGVANINILNESGKVDLNTARPELLHGLINSLDLSEEETLKIVDSILDWRDIDNLVRHHGAEDSEYKQENYPYGAKDGFFNTLSELQLVMGMTSKSFNQIKHAITVHSQHSSINIQSAPRLSLLAIPGIDEHQIDDFLHNRTMHSDMTIASTLTNVDPKYINKSNNKTFTISSEGVFGNTHAILEVVVLFKRYLNHPYTVLSWRESSGKNKGNE